MLSPLQNIIELPVGTHEGKGGILVLKERFPRDSLPSALLFWLAATYLCDCENEPGQCLFLSAGIAC